MRNISEPACHSTTRHLLLCGQVRGVDLEGTHGFGGELSSVEPCTSKGSPLINCESISIQLIYPLSNLPFPTPNQFNMFSNHSKNTSQPNHSITQSLYLASNPLKNRTSLLTTYSCCLVPFRLIPFCVDAFMNSCHHYCKVLVFESLSLLVWCLRGH